MQIAVRGGSDQPVVEVAANERHERSASRMDPADRQLTGKVRNLRIIARQDVELQLGCGFQGEAGMLLSEPGCLRLAATINAKQHYRRWAGALVCFFTHDVGLLESKRDPAKGPLGSSGRLFTLRPKPPGSAIFAASSDEKLHLQRITTIS
jgi:hypothetical protein